MIEFDQYQHFSAVFHLKQFSPDYFKAIKKGKKVNSRQCRVYHYEKQKPLNLEFKPIRYLCGATNFFNKVFEQYTMKKIDTSSTNKTLESIIKNRDFQHLNPKERENIRVLILSYIARTKARRQRDQNRINHMKRLPREIFNKSIESLFYGVQQDKLVNNEFILRKFQQQQVYVLSKYPQLLEPYYWTLLINKTNIPFIITDNPVLTNSHLYVIRKYIYQIRIPFLGYPEGFFLPISPRLGLMLYQFRKIRYPLLPNKIAINHRNFMLILNNRMIKYAHKDIITSFKSLNLLKSIIRRDPKCLEPINWRFQKIRLNHDKTRINKLIERQPNFHCEFCRKPFETKPQYTQHLNDPIVHLERAMKCPYCKNGRKFKNDEGLWQHIKAKHPNRLY